MKSVNKDDDTLELSLVKGAHRYAFVYDEGMEEAVVEQLMAWAECDDLEFDWFDAAIMSRQINRKLLGEVPKSP
ncbi:MAG: hypothetical protein QGD94_07480 [Planctomycetia bacterium]|nr:hypothetical protein [Planctomycetia bacterium]